MEANNTLTTDTDSSIIFFINRILYEAIDNYASDIHFEPYETIYRIRYRQDGLLRSIPSPPFDHVTRIAARIKIMANLDIAERRIPQDGRFDFSHTDNRLIDCRVSICPTLFGEKVVIRLLNLSHNVPTIEMLNLNAQQTPLFFNALSKPQGLILVTGPTGSGKTSTLYAALHYLNCNEKNISTIEDPVEIKLNGVNQLQIQPKIGLTFANALRAFLRQDPDIIMVGEIRDEETAQIAIHAAQTGHLVLSTLHTNNTIQTISRLINLGISPLHITETVNLIVAQRLIRRLCEYCKIKENNIYKARGCNQCHQGYFGRVAIFEILLLSNLLKQNILAGNSSEHLLTMVKKEGFITLYQSGIEQISKGVTTREEIERVLGVADEYRFV